MVSCCHRAAFSIASEARERSAAPIRGEQGGYQRSHEVAESIMGVRQIGGGEGVRVFAEHRRLAQFGIRIRNPMDRL